MKILFIIPEFYPHPGGGIATYYQNLLPALALSNNEISVLVGSGYVTGNAQAYFKNIKVEYLSEALLAKYKARFQKLDVWPELQAHLASAWAMFEQANEGAGYDIVETTDWGYGYVPWVITRKKPVIVRMHGSCAQIETNDPRMGVGIWADIMRMLEAKTLPLADTRITYSRNNKAFWEQTLDCEVEYVPPMYELPQTDLEPTSGTERKDYALVVGRIQYWKGAEALCLALQQMDLPIPIYWIGRDTDYREKGKSYHAYLSAKYPSVWGKKIIPLGAKPREETLQWMQGARFGIVPSTWDMFNFTTIEWLSLGKPVICSRGAGAWELVQQTQGGAIFTAGNADQLADLMGQWMQHPKNELDAIGQTGKQNLSNVLDINRLVEQNLRLYRQTLQTGQPGNLEIQTWNYGLWRPDKEASARQATMREWPLKEMVKQLAARLQEKIFRR